MDHNRGGRPRHPDVLTPAEWRVLEELRKGGTNAEIAVRLGVSPDAVKYHISNMLGKLDRDSRHQLAAWRPERDRRRLLGGLAVPGGFASLGRLFLWAGAGLAGIAAAAVVAVVLVAVLSGSDDEWQLVPVGEETSGTPVESWDCGRGLTCEMEVPEEVARVEFMVGVGWTVNGDLMGRSLGWWEVWISGLPGSETKDGQIYCVFRNGACDGKPYATPRGEITERMLASFRVVGELEPVTPRTWSGVQMWSCPPGVCLMEVPAEVGVEYEAPLYYEAPLSIGGTLHQWRVFREGETVGTLECFLPNGRRPCGGQPTQPPIVAITDDGVVVSDENRAFLERMAATFEWVCLDEVRCGELLDSSTPPAPPSATEGAEEALMVSTAGDFTCALRVIGTIDCWGGQNKVARVAMDAPPGNFESVSVGGSHACALKETGEIVCWGFDSYGETSAPSGRYRSVDAGPTHTCAVRETGEIDCWGANWFGQRHAPSGRYRSVSAGGQHTCGVRETGEVDCWGANQHGEAKAPAGKYQMVSAGRLSTCGVRETGKIDCWGVFGNAELEAPAGTYKLVSVDAFHTCAVRLTGEIDCWTILDEGLVGAPTGTYRSVSVAGLRTCGVRETGETVCWRAIEIDQGSVP